MVKKCNNLEPVLAGFAADKSDTTYYQYRRYNKIASAAEVPILRVIATGRAGEGSADGQLRCEDICKDSSGTGTSLDHFVASVPGCREIPGKAEETGPKPTL